MKQNPSKLTPACSHWAQGKPQNSETSVTGSSGAGWGLHSSEQAKDKLFTTTANNLAVIDAAYTLETDYSNTRYFNELHKAILNVYEHIDRD